MPTTQEFHDAILGAVADLKSHTDAAAQRVTDALAVLQAEIDKLIAANPSVDFSDVQAAVGTVQTEVDGIAPAAPTA